MWLPVMDHRNNAVANPNAFQINTAKMRCLTKGLSMHGLGAYIYAGEDLPAPEPEKTYEQWCEENKEQHHCYQRQGLPAKTLHPQRKHGSS